MNQDFATAMRRALQKTRAADPAAATAILRSALAGGAGPGAADAPCGPCAAAVDAGGLGGFGPGAGDAGPAGPGPNLSGLAGLSGHSGLGRSRFGAAQARTTRAPVPDGARVETRRHSGPAGDRDYRLFVPSPRAEGMRGLVLMLHGCTQSPEDFARGTGMDLAAEEAGFVVAYPGQTGRHNAQSCWNWFRPGDQVRDGGEPQILAALAREVAEEFGIGDRIHAAGLSAGGAMAAVLGETHGDVFASIGVHSGLPAGAARDVPSAFAAMRGEGTGRAPTVPAIVFHGTADRTVAPANARALVAGSGIETRGSGGGRTWSRLTTTSGSELWLVDGAGHAWFGGNPAGSYADPAGPPAAAEMLRFFAAGRPPRSP